MSIEVLVTGHPNTGTSFLCELIAHMGYSPGSTRHLKAADEHNLHGYWEHRPLQALLRATCGFNSQMWPHGLWPDKPGDVDGEAAEAAKTLATHDGVQVFKDCCVPLVYPLFPDAKVVAITRDKGAVYRSGQQSGDVVDWLTFKRGYDAYHRLLGYCLREQGGLLTRYESFETDFEFEAGRVVRYLGAECDVERLREVWKPR